MIIMMWEQTHSKGNGKNEGRHTNRMEPDCLGCDLYSQGKERGVRNGLGEEWEGREEETRKSFRKCCL